VRTVHDAGYLRDQNRLVLHRVEVPLRPRAGVVAGTRCATLRACRRRIGVEGDKHGDGVVLHRNVHVDYAPRAFQSQGPAVWVPILHPGMLSPASSRIETAHPTLHSDENEGAASNTG